MIGVRLARLSSVRPSHSAVKKSSFACGVLLNETEIPLLVAGFAATLCPSCKWRLPETQSQFLERPSDQRRRYSRRPRATLGIQATRQGNNPAPNPHVPLLADDRMPGFACQAARFRNGGGTSRTWGNVRLESAKRAKAGTDRVAVTNRDFVSTRPSVRP